ncbi:hypothetical protein [Bacteroides sedimenti]|uniref:Uncharacterized protein n=1 Tax=Bacteroides sedimenti TaxID=2136147 RepID=A0ABM8IL66_9BACE
MKDSNKPKEREEVSAVIKKMMEKAEKHEITIEEARRLSVKAKEEIDKQMKQVDELISDAVLAYKKECEDRSVFFDEPSVSSSIVGPKYVHLYNRSRLLAKYDIKSGEVTIAKS